MRTILFSLFQFLIQCWKKAKQSFVIAILRKKEALECPIKLTLINNLSLSRNVGFTAVQVLTSTHILLADNSLRVSSEVFKVSIFDAVSEKRH